MTVENEILRYIQNEKDISRYKISTLERRSNISASQKRILNMEKEFLKLSLEMMDFEDVADVAAAISIYKTSRNLFYKTYNLEPPEDYQINKEALVKALNDKIAFIKKTGHALTHVRVQELNLVQNSDFHYDFAKRQSVKNRTSIDIEKRQLDALSFRELLETEPLTIAKKRARSQALTFSIGLYLASSVKGLVVKEDMSLEVLVETNEVLDSIVGNIKHNVYSYYNFGLSVLPKMLRGTMGENSYLSKLHELQNILDFASLKKFGSMPDPIYDPGSFSKSKPVLGNIFYGAKKIVASTPTRDSERNVQNKVFGILLPIPRRGNEKMSLLYKNIKVDGFNISHLFTDSLSNVKAVENNKEVYYKGVLMHPLWRIIEMAGTDTTSRYILSRIIDFERNKFEDINFDDMSVINKINNNHTGFIDISDDSVILTAKTRSEEEGLSDIFTIANYRISEIKDDYAKLIGATNEIFLEQKG